MAPGSTRADFAARLGAVPFFARLEPADLAALAEEAEWREYAPGEVIFLEGEPAPGLFILAAGYVKVVKTSSQGREQSLEFIAPGQPFNTVAVFTSHPSPATAIALEASAAWMLPRSRVRRLLRESPAFAEQVIESMADRMVFLVSLVADLSLRSVTERLARLLLDQAVGGVVHRPRWYTVPELAARLGTVPDVAQRALGKLANDGLIEVTRREIRITDQAGLEALAG
jgi:CRP/FNR family transcriptional regulator